MKISKVIKAKGLRLEDVANELKSKNGNTMSPGTFRQLISNDSNPTIFTVKRIARAVEVAASTKGIPCACDWREFFADETENNSTNDIRLQELQELSKTIISTIDRQSEELKRLRERVELLTRVRP